jgi:hypothetical protein
VIRYEERFPNRRAWTIFAGCVIALWSVIALTEAGPLGATILVGMLTLIAGAAMWSTGFYGNIRLTDDELRAGRAQIPLRELDPTGVSRPGDVVRGKLVGGAYAPTLGWTVLGLRRSSGEVIRVQTRNPDALRAALEAVLSTAHRTG